VNIFCRIRLEKQKEETTLDISVTEKVNEKKSRILKGGEL
jgi:hypothetical protein